MLQYVYLREATLCYSEAAFGPKLPQFLLENLERLLHVISNVYVCICIPNSMSVCQTSFKYISEFLDYGTFNFWEVLHFLPHPPRGFLLIILFLRIIHCLFSEGLKYHWFLYVCTLFPVKRLSSLMLSMYL